MIHGYVYEVYVEMSMTLAQATFLKTVASSHYDWKVKSAATGGCINGLFNVATWTEEKRQESPTAPAIPLRVSWDDCDTMMKCMEQAHYHVKTDDDYQLNKSILNELQTAMDSMSQRTKAVRLAFKADSWYDSAKFDKTYDNR